MKKKFGHIDATTCDIRGWGMVRTAAIYMGVSVRSFRDHLKRGLPHVKLPSGTILVKFSDIDHWLDQHRVTDADDAYLDRIVSETLKDF